MVVGIVQGRHIPSKFGGVKTDLEKWIVHMVAHDGCLVI
jgi:hypothetical protein